MSDAANPRAALSGIIRLLTSLGGCLFLISFFLPALRSKVPHDSMPGWKCAGYALIPPLLELPNFFNNTNTGRSFGDQWGNSNSFPIIAVLSLMGDSINLLAPIYLISYLRERRTKVHSWLAAAVLVCIVATWWDFYLIGGTFPAVGYYFWAVGALLILSPELESSLSSRRPGS
jgi:hypothetical protein